MNNTRNRILFSLIIFQTFFCVLKQLTNFLYSTLRTNKNISMQKILEPLGSHLVDNYFLTVVDVVWSQGRMMNLLNRLIDFLVPCIGQSAVDAWRQTSAIDADLSNLQAALPKARLLIERSECWRLPKYNPIDKLLPQLKDAVYEAEIIVDELKYQRLKNEFESSFPGTNFLRNWMSDFPTTVKRVIEKLNNVFNEMKETCDRHCIPENPNKFSETARPITSTFLDAANVYGRNKELMDVIDLIGVPKLGQRKRTRKMKVGNLDIGESSNVLNKKENISVLSIVGMGGVGKTTLAQMVCNETRVKSYFNPIMWVCISDKFDNIRLTREIVENATKKECNLTNLEALHRTLQEILSSKRFLLVLDDVWSKDWQRLLAPMNGAAEGSVFMVTTRSQECVEILGIGMNSRGSINLEGLEEGIYWEFFKSCANYSNIINPELESIGREICGRLKGSPLAAKTIGGLLKTNMDERYWRNIKNSEMWKLQEREYDIHPVLQLSYQYLPSNLKKCFSFCSLYPKDFKFTKWELIKLWIMQGFIDLPQLEVHCDEPYIKEAEDCFRDLVQRCFFQKAPGSKSEEYVIHDLMHDVCQSITKDECFCIEDDNWEKNVSPNIRHLSIFGKEIKKKEQEKLCKYAKLLSVRVGPQSSCLRTVINKWCEKLINIRSLSISKCKFKSLPESIGKLKHLQYLDISFSKIGKIPETFYALYNLVYLNLEGCDNIDFSPEGFDKLVNLKFLYLPKNKLILVGHRENLVSKIDCKDMRTLVNTHQKIENLKFMNNLRGYLIIEHLENVPSKTAAQEAHLDEKQFITELSLKFGYSWEHFNDQPVSKDDEEVLQGLRPHRNLKKLIIGGYRGRNLSPSWLTEQLLPNLTEVIISSCKNVLSISHLPRFIRYIDISYCLQLTDLQNCLGPNHLPGLQKLVIRYCPELVSIAAESFGEFLSLEELTIAQNLPAQMQWYYRPL